LTLSNTSSVLTWSLKLIFSILLQHHISKLYRCFWYSRYIKYFSLCVYLCLFTFPVKSVSYTRGRSKIGNDFNFHTSALMQFYVTVRQSVRTKHCIIVIQKLHVSAAWGSHHEASYFKNITHGLLLLQLYTQKYSWQSSSRLIQNICKN
jgi:hypothetical protein